MQPKVEIETLPKDLDEFDFQVDIIVQEEDRFDLGNGVDWSAYAVLGHSACQMAFFEAKEQFLAIGDATGAKSWTNLQKFEH